MDSVITGEKPKNVEDFLLKDGYWFVISSLRQSGSELTIGSRVFVDSGQARSFLGFGSPICCSCINKTVMCDQLLPLDTCLRWTQFLPDSG